MLSCTDNGAELLREAARFDADLHAGLADVVTETCEAGAAHARAAGRFTDRSEDGLRANVRGVLIRRTDKGAEGEIAALKPYASYVEEGTPAHEIYPRRAGALAFVGRAGELQFARRVNHPGSRAFPFMGPAYLKAEGALRATTERLCARLLARLG